MASLDKMAMHQGTTPFWTFAQAVDAYARYGFRAMSARREKLHEHGVAAGAKLMRDAGMDVIGLSGPVPMTASDPAERTRQRDENRRAIDDAAAIGARFIVITGGPLPPGSKDMQGARNAVRDMMGELLPHARERGVGLGLEPLTPMVAGENSCVNTMALANGICEELGAGTGVVVDVYHVWWDPALEAELMRCGTNGQLYAFHICDWRVPTRDRFQDRAMMGDGVIDIPQIGRWMRKAGFDGYNEIEIFSAADWWTRDPAEFITTCVARYQSHV